ncbi:MAG TPA: hypothetical protein VMV72_08915 [Verrucomicrobiae bacterium]|nr:hypothetical protein [Verrucomicrobiae bacterium]
MTMNRIFFKGVLVSLAVGWATLGAVRADDSQTNSPIQVSGTPEVTYAKVSGNKQKFREDVGIKEGWNGGVEEGTLHYNLGKNTTLDGEGRFIIDEHDYKFQLQLTKQDVGYVRAGYTEYREYYDNQGGFYGPFTPQSLHLGRDLRVDNSDIFFEAGLTLPDRPKVTIAYERQSRDGDESLVEWGGVTQGGTTRKIYPSFDDIKEHTDIVRLNVEYDIHKVHLADQFLYEHFSHEDTRNDASLNLDTTSSQTTTVHEDYHHDDFNNTFHADCHVNDKVYWSLGYLHSSLSGNGDMSVVTPPPLGPFDLAGTASPISVDLDSDVVNLSGMLGPFKGLVFYGGLDGEVTDTHGFSRAVFGPGAGATTNVIHSSENTKNLSETLGLRYTKIPYTTLYAEGQWNEERIDLDQDETQDSVSSLGLDSNETSFRQDYRVGFNTAPLPRMTLAARYRHYIDHDDYDYPTDTVVGYPGFITAQDFTTDEIMTKLTLRPCSRFNVAFTYQLVSTDIRTTTESIPVLLPGGELQSGDYDANIYSVSATVTPMSRWYLTGYFSLQDTRTASVADGNPAVVAYRGNVYTVMATSGYALDKKTDLTLSYSYSCSDNFNNNSASGLPLGLNFQRHEVQAGVSRKIRPNVVAHLRYGFYSYDESSTGGYNNYIAHLATASCSVRF